MSVARTAFSLVRRVPFQAARVAPRTFTTVTARRASKYDPKPGDPEGKLLPFEEIKTEADLIPPGAARGTVPTDLEQATGLERLEILGKMQGIDIFDMSPLPSDRLGTFDDPITVKSAGNEYQVGCTGSPADSHNVKWLVLSRKRPFERCLECGSVYRMDYVGPPDQHDDHHGDHHHGFEEPKTMADFVKPEYWYR
ncbi:Cytochrome c oxidase subunit 4, mitochondrial [Cladophialophora carrionii]|uniref:Cytochrome c oxidase subunit 4, mitochondrial n=1 Tax=Cladophialophora carrionii TaxID=86049 RepID=A0A1C1CMJ6_9EURO|nr:Cytochrome c oxidase subunit 4, mitochondrial [Cladophialophora carrionii]